MTPSLPPSKEAQRPYLRRIRQKLCADTTARRDKETRACANALQLLSQQAQQTPQAHLTIALYAPFGSELNCHLMIPALLERHYHLALPQIKGSAMRFVPWDGASALCAGPFGINAPITLDNSAEVCPDILIVPCLGFNSEKYRLGYGGGFYDRWLKAHQPAPLSIGLAFAEQQTDFATEVHDYRLDQIVTEQGAFQA